MDSFTSKEALKRVQLLDGLRSIVPDGSKGQEVGKAVPKEVMSDDDVAYSIQKLRSEVDVLMSAYAYYKTRQDDEAQGYADDVLVMVKEYKGLMDDLKRVRYERENFTDTQAPSGGAMGAASGAPSMPTDIMDMLRSKEGGLP